MENPNSGGGGGIHLNVNHNNNHGVPSTQNLSQTVSMLNGGNKQDGSTNANGNYSIKSSSSATTIENGNRNSTEEIHHLIDQEPGDGSGGGDGIIGHGASVIGLRMNNGDGTFGNMRRSKFC